MIIGKESFHSNHFKLWLLLLLTGKGLQTPHFKLVLQNLLFDCLFLPLCVLRDGKCDVFVYTDGFPFMWCELLLMWGELLFMWRELLKIYVVWAIEGIHYWNMLQWVSCNVVWPFQCIHYRNMKWLIKPYNCTYCIIILCMCGVTLDTFILVSLLLNIMFLYF